LELTVAVLTTTELAALRRQIGEGVVPITWDKNTINAATQGVEDVLEAQGFDASTLVAVTTVANPDSQEVLDELTASRLPAGVRRIAEAFLRDNPASVTTRSVDNGAIADFLRDNSAVFTRAVAGMPGPVRNKLVRAVIKRRVEAVV
jgi:hypothetical protein